MTHFIEYTFKSAAGRTVAHCMATFERDVATRIEGNATELQVYAAIDGNADHVGALSITRRQIDDVLTVDGADCPAIEAPLWWQLRGLSYTATGYGARIPTHHMVHYQGRWRRVYCRIYSNVGTCFVTVKGERVVVC